MIKQICMYLSPAQQRVVEQGIELGLGPSPAKVFQSLANFALFRFQGSSEPVVAASERLETDVQLLILKVRTLQNELRAVDAALTAILAGATAAEEAHLTLRAEVNRLAQAAQLTQHHTGASP